MLNSSSTSNEMLETEISSKIHRLAHVLSIKPRNYPSLFPNPSLIFLLGEKRHNKDLDKYKSN